MTWEIYTPARSTADRKHEKHVRDWWSRQVTTDPDGTTNADILHEPYPQSDPRNWVRPGDDDDQQDQA